MRRQRLLRNVTSPQSLCIFCLASRSFLAPQALTSTTRTPRRRLNTTHPPRQSTAAAEAQAPLDGNGNTNPPSDGSYSILTPAEQREKEHRRQLRIARERQHEQQRIEELERRHVATEAARKEEGRRRTEEEGRRRAAALETERRQAEKREADRKTMSGGRGDNGMSFRKHTDRREDVHGRPSEQSGMNGNVVKQARGLKIRKHDVDVESTGENTEQASREDAVFGHRTGVQSSSADQRPQPETKPAQASMPSFGSFGVQRDQGHGVGAGWGSGTVEVKPLQYAEDDENAGTRPTRRSLSGGATAGAPRPPRRNETFEDVFGGLDDPGSPPQTSRGASRNQDRFWNRNSDSFRQTRNGNGGYQRTPQPRNEHSPSLFDNGTAYRATPFNPSDEYKESVFGNDDPAQTKSWQHLRSRVANSQPPAPPQAQPRYPPPQRSSPFDDDPETIERQFRQHQQQRQPSFRPMRASNVEPPNPNIRTFESSPQPNGGQTVRKCARCLEVGHTARECTGPTKAVCNYCGERGHMGFECSRNPRRRTDQGQRGGGGIPNAPFTAAAEEAGRDEDISLWKNGNKLRDGKDERSVGFTRPVMQMEREAEEKPRREAKPVFTEEDEIVDEEEAERRARRERRGFIEDEHSAVEALPERRERRKGRRSMEREDDEAADEADAAREERAARKAARKAQRQAEKAEKAAQVTLPDFISVSQLAQTLGIRYERLMERLEQLGYDDVFPGKVLNEEVSGMIAMEYDFEPVFESSSSTREEDERDLKARPELLDKSLLPTRPPVVTIMGHVDHGKTTILDFLRKSSVAAGEAGGITQHIGAFSVPMAASGRTITFLDTPGHAAFLAMRQRGANVTDIVILVVAADDSVKPQTLESLRCAREAGVPILVAINKVDKEGADVQRVKQDLARNGVEIEDFGGEVQTVSVSGKTGEGMEDLEEAVVALSETLDHRAEDDGEVEGWLLEATTKSHGRVATVLVKRGTLTPGQVLVARNTWARVKTLRDQTGRVVPEVGPGLPVEVDGWREQPVAGDEVLQAPSEQKASSVVAFRTEKEERERMSVDMEVINEARRLEQEKRAREKAAGDAAKNGVDQLPEALQQSQETSSTTNGQVTIPFLIKADVSGSAEAVSAYIPSLTSPLAAPVILNSVVGPVHESDIELAAAAQGHIIAFNLPANPEMQGQAEAQGVKILENDVIYRVLDQVKDMLEAKLPPIVTQRVLGEAEVSAGFEIGVGGRKKLKIAGCKVRNGVMGWRARVRVLRSGEKVYDGTIGSLKNVKKDVQEMRKGSECGMGFDNWEGFEVGDLIQTYEEVSEKRRL